MWVFPFIFSVHYYQYNDGLFFCMWKLQIFFYFICISINVKNRDWSHIWRCVLLYWYIIIRCVVSWILSSFSVFSYIWSNFSISCQQLSPFSYTNYFFFNKLCRHARCAYDLLIYGIFSLNFFYFLQMKVFTWLELAKSKTKQNIDKHN